MLMKMNEIWRSIFDPHVEIDDVFHQEVNSVDADGHNVVVWKTCSAKELLNGLTIDMFSVISLQGSGNLNLLKPQSMLEVGTLHQVDALPTDVIDSINLPKS